MQRPFSFALLGKIVASLVGMSLFHLVVTFQVEVFLNCTFAETFENGFQNRFYFENFDFAGFGQNISRFSSVMTEGTEVSKKCANFVLF